MAFMRAFVSKSPEVWVTNEYTHEEMRTLFPDGWYADLEDDDMRELADALGLSAEQLIAERDRIFDAIGYGEFTVTTGYRGWLSAPGYLDHTDPVIYHTQGDAATALLEMYYDDEMCNMDVYDLRDVMYLAELAGDDELFKEAEQELSLRAD